MSDLINHLRSELAEIRAEIRDMNNTVREYMSEQAGAISKLTERSEVAERNITELWNQLNHTKARADALGQQIKEIEGKAIGQSKVIAWIFAACGALGAIVALIK